MKKKYFINIMNLIFLLTCVLHILVWGYILLAFINKTTAYYNIYYVIPLIYIIHMLPIHLLISVKKNIYPNSWESKNNNIKNTLIIPQLFANIQKILYDKCFLSPLSTQGMLIFGLITSIFKLYPPNYFS